MSDKAKARKYLLQRGYGTGTNYTTSVVSSLMQSYADQELKNVLEDIREEMCGVSPEYHKELLEDALTHLKQNKR